MKVIEKALQEGLTTLSEYDSKQILAEYKIPVTREIIIHDIEQISQIGDEIGFPVVLKGCAAGIAHKTEDDLIRMDIRDENEASTAFNEIINNMNGSTKDILVQEMVKGKRELVMGLIRDPQFGPCVMFGLGGIFTEILKDISFRVAPLTKNDAMEMMTEIKGHKILEAIRGMKEADMEQLAEILINLGQIGLENDKVKEIDINPVIISGGKPIAVDALVVLN